MSTRPLFLLALLSACNGGTEGSTRRGCIENIDSGERFDVLDFAMAAATDGDVLKLCTGALSASITVDTELTLRGNGAGRTVLIAPDGENVITLRGGSLTLEGLSLSSTRSGIQATDGQLHLSDVSLSQLGNYGVVSENTEITADSVSLSVAGWGGFRLDGGSLTLSNSTLSDAIGFGVSAENGASVVIENTSCSGTFVTGQGEDTDGFCVQVLNNSEATLRSVDFSNNTFGGVRVDASTLTLSDSTLSNNWAGLWLDAAISVTVENTEIRDTQVYGAVILSSHFVDFNGVDIITDPAAAASDDPETADTDEGSFGIRSVDSDIVMRDGTISGANSAGVFINAQLTTAISLDFTNVIFEDNAKAGVIALVGKVDFTDVSVLNSRTHPACEQDGYNLCNFSFYTDQVALTWTGAEIGQNAGWGGFVSNGSLSLKDATIHHNDEYGIMAWNAAFTGDNVTFDAAAQTALMLDTSEATLINSQFINGQFDDVFDMGDGAQWITHRSGVDIANQDFGGSRLTVVNGQFSDGDQVIQGQNLEIDLQDVSISGYNVRAVDVYQGQLNLSRVTFSNVGGQSVNCVAGKASLSAVQFERITKTQESYEVIEADGTISSSSDLQNVWPALSGNGCEALLEDVAFSDLVGGAIEYRGGTLEVDGLQVSKSGTAEGETSHAINAMWTGIQPAEVFLNRVEIDGSAADAIHLVGLEGDERLNDQVDLVDVSVGARGGVQAGGGLYFEGLKGINLSGFSVDNISTFGLNFIDITGRIDGGADGASGEIRGGRVGLSAQNSDLTVVNTHWVDPTEDGVRLIGGAYDLSDLTVSGALGYGMTCASDVDLALEAPVFNSCSNLSIAGGAGAQLGCDSCSLF